MDETLIGCQIRVVVSQAMHTQATKVKSAGSIYICLCTHTQVSNNNNKKRMLPN